MARTLSSTAHNIASTNTATCPAAQGTIAFWFKPAWNSGDSAYHFLSRVVLSTSPNTREMGVLHATDNNLYVGWVDITGGDFDELVVSDAGLFTSGTWAHWAMTWSDSANTIELFKNGVSLGVRSTALVTYAAGTGYTHYIGNVGTFADARGDMWGYAVYDAVLSADDITSLAKGFSPAIVNPNALQCFVPLDSKTSPAPDQITGATWTVTGAAVAENPRVIY